ncbi:MAG: hypothetical protein HIU81_03890 [Acidobacteria bacterium]|nr:hypothetical protein [Acidobacteriota bacterium]
MAISSAGYPGTVDSIQYAKMSSSLGASTYGVSTPDGLKVTAHPSIAQAVNIAPETTGFWGPGVFDTSDAIVTLVAEPVTSDTRWDLVVAHRDWTTNETKLVLLKGSPAKQFPVRDEEPGVADDQPIWLVQWTAGQTKPTGMVDLRCWAGNGGIIAKDKLALGYLARLGAQVLVGSTQWRYVIGSNNIAEWSRASVGAVVYKAADWMGGAVPIATVNNGNQILLAQINIPDPGYPYHVQAWVNMESGADGATRWDPHVDLPNNAYLAFRAKIEGGGGWIQFSGATQTPLVGSATADLKLSRLYGSGEFALTPYNRRFQIMVIPAGS